MSLTLGSTPESLTVRLTKNADFMSSIRRKDDTDWPAGCQLYLEFTTGTNVEQWPASFSGSVASWTEDQTVVDAVIAKKIKSVRLWYVQGTIKLLWAIGDADVRGV